jgi:hypothetical protein
VIPETADERPIAFERVVAASVATLVAGPVAVVVALAWRAHEGHLPARCSGSELLAGGAGVASALAIAFAFAEALVATGRARYAPAASLLAGPAAVLSGHYTAFVEQAGLLAAVAPFGSLRPDRVLIEATTVAYFAACLGVPVVAIRARAGGAARTCGGALLGVAVFFGSLSPEGDRYYGSDEEVLRLLVFSTIVVVAGFVPGLSLGDRAVGPILRWLGQGDREPAAPRRQLRRSLGVALGELRASDRAVPGALVLVVAGLVEHFLLGGVVLGAFGLNFGRLGDEAILLAVLAHGLMFWLVRAPTAAGWGSRRLVALVVGLVALAIVPRGWELDEETAARAVAVPLLAACALWLDGGRRSLERGLWVTACGAIAAIGSFGVARCVWLLRLNTGGPDRFLATSLEGLLPIFFDLDFHFVLVAALGGLVGASLARFAPRRRALLGIALVVLAVVAVGRELACSTAENDPFHQPTSRTEWLRFAEIRDVGIDGPELPEEADRAYREAAEAGSPEAMYRLGLRLEQGRRTRRDPVAAASWLRKAAEAGVPEASEAVAASVEASDPGAAREWRERAARQGSAFPEAGGRRAR